MCCLASCKRNYRNEFTFHPDALPASFRLGSHIFLIFLHCVCIKDAALFFLSTQKQNYNHLFLLILFFVSFNSIICVYCAVLPKKKLILFLKGKAQSVNTLLFLLNEFQEWNCFSNDLPLDKLNTYLPSANNNLRVLLLLLRLPLQTT